MTNLEETPDSETDWPRNYFNYFTEIEEHFRQARGTGLFLMSPVDWALIENWKNAGVPLEAVLKGIDEAFDKWRSRKHKRRRVNSVTYCTQAVMKAAQRVPPDRESARNTRGSLHMRSACFLLNQAVTAIRQKPDAAFDEIASAVQELAQHAAEHLTNLETWKDDSRYSRKSSWLSFEVYKAKRISTPCAKHSIAS